MNIAVVGTGYVGLVTGTCFAETGNDVICVDINAEKVEQMRNGIVPIYEPHLDVLFERNIKNGRLTFTTNLEEAIKDAQVIFLALPTPPGEDGSADLSYILRVSRQLGQMIKDYKVIVDKSTVPVGTSEKVKQTIASLTEVPFDVVSNPEFLREGFAVDDFMKPDRVVIGTESPRAQKVMENLYKPFVRQGNPLIIMDEKSAELTKYAANAFLATKITFMNEIANFCEKVGADVDKVRLGIGSDTRIGKRFLFPGIGYGGSCFPKDVLALQRSGREENYEFQVLNAVIAVNERQKTTLVDKLKRFYDGNLKGKKIALWGLAFKPDTDDIREAPAIYIINQLIALGAEVTAYDPEAIANSERMLGDRINFAKDQYSALEGADALLIATEWGAFRNPDFDKMRNLMSVPAIFDGRNVYDIDQMQELDFYYESVGREVVNPFHE
jgi:UDPglucose 6-dehydrogenase